MFYSHDLFGDGVSNGTLKEILKDLGMFLLQNVRLYRLDGIFVRHGRNQSVSYSREEISYALLPLIFLQQQFVTEEKKDEH